MIKKIYYSSIKLARNLYYMLNPSSKPTHRNWKMFSNKAYSNELIYKALMSGKPQMIARFGSTEMLNMVNYIGVKHKAKLKSYKLFVKGKTPPWWWEKSSIVQLKNWSGFFPVEIKLVEQFCELMLRDIKEIDILGSWLNDENYFKQELSDVKKIVLEDMEPFFAPNPWTRALEGKKVLVIHPFVDTIKEQYKKRKLLFDNNFLPEFELKTIKAVQSIAGIDTEFKTWFDALNHMKKQIDETDFDICIIGAGAYGLPLAAHVKRNGKMAVHLAGVTQLLFGIIGNRWEEYIVWPYSNLFNSHWVRPSENEKPHGADKVEGACYW